MQKYNVFRGEDWLGCVTAGSHEEAVLAADANPDFKGWTSVEERGEPPLGRSGAV